MRRFLSWMDDHSWLVLILPAAAGIALDWFVTRNGAGISGDGVWYVDGAQNILKGFGYGILRGDGFVPTTLYPPFYSIVLSGLGIFGGSIYELARTLNAVLLGGNIFLVGWLIFRLTRSAGFALSGSLLLLVSLDLLKIHTWVMTEPLFIFLTLLCLLNIHFYFEKGRLFNLGVAGLTAGLAVITRYVGIALIVIVMLPIVFSSRDTWQKRLLKVIAAGVIGFLPLGLWFTRNALLDLPLSGRSALEFRALPKETIAAFMNTVWSWIFPDSLGIPYRPRFLLLIVLLLIVGGLSLYGLVHQIKHQPLFRQSNYAHFLILMPVLMVTYACTVIVSIVSSLAGNPFIWNFTDIPRYLIPVHVIFVLWINLVFFQWLQILGKHKLLRLIPVITTICLLGINIAQFDIPRTNFYFGYADTKFYRQDVVSALKAIDPTRPIITNDYEEINFLVGRPVYGIPGQVDELTGLPNPEHAQLMQKIESLIDQDAVVVIFRPDPATNFFFDPLLARLEPRQDFGKFIFYEKSASGK